MLASLLNTDRAVGIWLASVISGPWLDRVMVWATIVGARGTIWIAIGLVSAIVAPAKRMAVWRLLLSIALAGLIVDGIAKPLVGRVRPWVGHPEYRDLGLRPEDTSFPSGHAATAAAGALALTRLWPAAAVPAAALALLIGTSRVALGVHFPGDVLGGFALGYLCARFVCARPPREFRSPAGAPIGSEPRTKTVTA
jgi:undecaprenyl-diphosphatase